MNVARRVWGLPVSAHLAALVVVLGVAAMVVGVGASFSADEGAAIIQARSLARGDGWIVEHPLAGVDPGGAYYPLELSARGPKGVAPFAKHPLYAVLLAGANRVGGERAMVALSLLGTLAAAAVAAALAGLLDLSLTRPAVWAVGVASPLLFDGNLVIAHTLGAAFAAGAVLAAVAALERRRLAVAGAIAPLMFVAVLLRTEALLFAVALAAVAALIAAAAVRARDRGRTLVAAGVAAGSMVAGLVATVVERGWARAIVGATPASTGGGPTNDSGFIAGRVKSFMLTWVRPGYDGGQVETLLVLMIVAIAVAGLLIRRQPVLPGPVGPVRMLAAIAAAAALLALAVSPHNLVPGFLVACPLLVAGKVAVRRSTLQTTTAQVAAGTFALFALAVIATQYTTGGSGEWGGRYFALGLPVIIPVLLLAVRDRGRQIPDDLTRYICAGALVVCSLVMASMGVASMRDTHRFTGNLLAGIARAGDMAGDGRSSGAGPVIVTTEAAIPRLAWATFEKQRWLLVTKGDMASMVGRLRNAGVDRLVVVTAGPNRADVLSPAVAEILFTAADLDRVGWRVVVARPV